MSIRLNIISKTKGIKMLQVHEHVYNVSILFHLYWFIKIIYKYILQKYFKYLIHYHLFCTCKIELLLLCRYI